MRRLQTPRPLNNEYLRKAITYNFKLTRNWYSAVLHITAYFFYHTYLLQYG